MYNRILSGSVRTLEHDSVVLKGNPLGDPHVRRFPVYLPPGYDESGERYPVIYVLAGFTGTGLNMPNFAVWDESLPEQIDDLVVSGTCPPVIVVMPDCFTRWGAASTWIRRLRGPTRPILPASLCPSLMPPCAPFPRQVAGA